MLKSFVFLTLLACVLCSLAQAFPPAPGIVVYGLVRDAAGEIVTGPNAFVVFRSGSVELTRVPLRAGLSEGENYRALLPSDMESGADSYRSEVLDAALPFTVSVEIGGQVFDPIESSVGMESPNTHGSAIRFDFTLGVDSDGDGLPDEWEYWQLRNGGVPSGSELFNLDQFSADGDFDLDGLTDREEYLTGTFAYLGFDTLSFKVLGVDAAGRLKLAFLAVDKHVYRFEGSVDLVDWEPIEVWLLDTSEGDALLGVYTATDTIVRDISIQEDDVGRLSYFRLRVKRGQ